jgi:hypothetical protein
VICFTVAQRRPGVTARATHVFELNRPTGLALDHSCRSGLSAGQCGVINGQPPLWAGCSGGVSPLKNPHRWPRRFELLSTRRLHARPVIHRLFLLLMIGHVGRQMGPATRDPVGGADVAVAAWAVSGAANARIAAVAERSLCIVRCPSGLRSRTAASRRTLRRIT